MPGGSSVCSADGDSEDRRRWRWLLSHDSGWKTSSNHYRARAAISTAVDPHCHHQHCKHYYRQASLATENASRAQTSPSHYRERAAISTAVDPHFHHHQHCKHYHHQASLATENPSRAQRLVVAREETCRGTGGVMSWHGRGYQARTAARSGRPPRAVAAGVDMETKVAGATLAEAPPLVAAVAAPDAAIAAATVAAMVPAEAAATVALPPVVGGTTSGLAETLLRVRSRAQGTGAESTACRYPGCRYHGVHYRDCCYQGCGFC